MICLIAKIDRSSNQEGVIATFYKKGLRAVVR